jgi:hypothetical protein
LRHLPGRGALRSATLVALGTGLWSGNALADDACAANRIETAGQLEPAWAEELAVVCKIVGSLPDLDVTTRIRVVAGDPVFVVATLPDGRTAHRQVRSVAALRHTIEALVTIPVTFSEGGAETQKQVDVKKEPVDAPPKPDTAEEPPRAEPSPLPLCVELGFIGIGRVQGSPLYASIGPVVWASFNFSDWLFGISARWDGYQAQPTGNLPGFEMMTFGAGLEFARRFKLHPIVGLDLGTTLGIVEEIQSFQGADGEQAGQSTDVRLVLLSRLHVGGRGVRFTADLEGEISPVRIGRDTKVDDALPALPSFGVGLGAGVSWQGP